ncbi:hypothetical protein JOF53_006464 [Crossiella equi]|uniref:Uncharacterized protein n=1 Tax=Crossiella equi TaxID=130796 RepID=A0ABS5ALZ6_9PSEU|nr:hypothetical protein [Crossiella equi]MBP2477592.1 hypothetical protein [Crossiella equi]
MEVAAVWASDGAALVNKLVLSDSEAAFDPEAVRPHRLSWEFPLEHTAQPWEWHSGLEQQR